MADRSAWFCPSCQKHHAPHCDTCPGGTGGIEAQPLTPLPTTPWPVVQPATIPLRIRPWPEPYTPDPFQPPWIVTCGGRVVRNDPSHFIMN